MHKFTKRAWGWVTFEVLNTTHYRKGVSLVVFQVEKGLNTKIKAETTQPKAPLLDCQMYRLSPDLVHADRHLSHMQI